MHPGQDGSKRVQRQVARAGVAIGGQLGGGTLFTEPILVVNQKAKLIEVNAEYAVYDQQGRQIGSVREVGQSMLRNAVSVAPKSSGKRTLQIVDQNGQILVTLTRPANVAKSRVIVRHANGAEIGQIVQKTFGILGKVRFDLVGGGQTLGSLSADSWGVWDFNIQNMVGSEVARITKGRTAFGGKTSTKKDKYVVEIYEELADPLRSLVVAAALAIDTVLRQNHK